MNKRHLSKKDSELLLKFLENPPEPNENLKMVFEKIEQMHQTDSNGRSLYNVNSTLIKEK